MEVMANRKRGLKKAAIPVQTKTTSPLQLSEADYRRHHRLPIDAYRTPQKITFGEMRRSGVRDVLIYCRDHR